MVQQDENEAYTPYSLLYPYTPYTPYTPYISSTNSTYSMYSASVGVLDAPSAPTTEEPSEQDVPLESPSGPNGMPPTPPTPPPTPQRGHGRGRATFLITALLIFVFGIGLFSGWVFTVKNSTGTTTSAQTTTSTSSSSANTVQALQENAIAKAEPGVVELEITTAQGEQIGSGVIIDSKGDIVTNNHVVSGEQSIVAVLYNGSKESAQLIGTSSANDLAVVRITPYKNMTIVQIADSSKLVTGQEVLAIGNPLGITETATEGIVSALNRSITESTGVTIAQAIQTDAAINPGNSGGALINLQGQLVGIPTLTAVNTETNTAANGIGFAIPSNTVKSIVQQLVQA